MARVTQHRLVAVPLVGERSGGVGQVSGLLWRAVSESWPDGSALVELLRERRLSPTLGDKLEFGWTMGARQLAGRARWILFGHLGLARVERYIPPGSRAPYAVFLHGVEAWRKLEPGELELVGGAELRLANSAYTARRASDVNPELGPIEVCPLALSDETERAGPAAADSSRVEVLVVGRMSSGERYKGHEQLIDSWPDVVAGQPHARLVIVGDGDDRARLEARARAGPAAGHIEFTGFLPRPELERRYQQAAVFAMPSRNEGFGLVYLEAMAHGLPCVASTRDAAGEIIRPGETGLLVDGDTPGEIAATLLELLRDPDRRRRMGEAGRERWRTEFTYERFKRRLVTLLSRSLEAVPAEA